MGTRSGGTGTRTGRISGLDLRNAAKQPGAKTSVIERAMQQTGMNVLSTSAGQVIARYDGATITARRTLGSGGTSREWAYRVVKDFGNAKNFDVIPTLSQISKVGK